MLAPWPSRSGESIKHILRALTLAATFPACTGSIDGSLAPDLSGETGTPNQPSTPGAGGKPSTGNPGDPAQPGQVGGGNPSTGAPKVPTGFVPAPARLRRLTTSQYQNTIRDLFGDSVRVPIDLEADNAVDGFTTVGASEVGVSQRGSEQFEAAARDVAHQVFTVDAARKAFVGCAPASASDPCVATFLRAFGRRAWRRSLDAAEVEAFAGLVKTAGAALQDTWAGMEYAVAGILLSPKFVYRVELGIADPANPQRLRFDGYEMATRLSYFLWDSTPDDALLDAAAAGELGSAAGLERQAARLAASPRAHASVQRFFSQYLSLSDLDNLEKNTKTFPQMTTTLGQAMRQEMTLFLEAAAFEQADFRDVFTWPVGFVNRDLAKVYGVTPPTDKTVYTRTTWSGDSPRVGLLGMPGFLAVNAHPILTSPTKRGHFIREQLLCSLVPPPPPDAMATLPDVAVTGPRTMRQRFEAHTVNPTCAACHNLMDPLGLPLEHFDAIGGYRQTDGGLALDTSGEVNGTKVNDAREMAVALRNNPGTAACVARKLFQYAAGHLYTDEEAPALEALDQKFQASGFSFAKLLVATVTNDAFRFTSGSL